MMADQSSATVRRSQLQYWLLSTWFCFFVLAIVLSICAFFYVRGLYNDLHQKGAVSRGIAAECSTQWSELKRDSSSFETQRKLKDIGYDADRYCKPGAASLLGNALGEVALGLYLPILGVMLTAFFSPSTGFREQKILRSQALVAVAAFALIQIINFVFLALFYFDSSVLDSNIRIAQSAALTTLMGIVVTFVFPEQKEEDPPQSSQFADGRDLPHSDGEPPQQ